MKIAILLLILAAIWLLTGAVEGYLEAKNRPRVPMEWCHQHGYFKKEHVLPIDEMGTTICPVCWQEAWKKAGKAR